MDFIEKYGNVEVRALSWKQPFASLMINGKVETRVWPTKYRGWVLICASKSAYTGKEMSKISGTKQMVRSGNTLPDHNVPLGQAIAIGKLSKCLLMSDFADRRESIEDRTFVKYNPDLILHFYEEVQPIVPFEWIGVQGWKTLTDEVKRKIRFP